MKALLNLMLLALMGYFLARSAAHFMGYKYPLLSCIGGRPEPSA